MTDRYLLYIDILGFAEIVRTGSEKISKLFAAIDRLNVHTDVTSKTIVFSDTILTFNLEDPDREDYHRTTVMYACEYVQDLMKWCTKLDIQFRAILLYGPFDYRRMKNFEAYHGMALIEAYKKEKDLPAMGLFISNDLVRLSDVFKIAPFDDQFGFVFLTQELEHMRNYYNGELPLPWELLIDSPSFLWAELDMLRALRDGIAKFDGKVKEKYLNTYDIYRQRYGDMFRTLEEGNFDLSVVNATIDWQDVREDRWNLDDLSSSV